MDYTFYHCFHDGYVLDPIPDNVKLEMAKERAANELAKKLVEEAQAEITYDGNVKIVIRT